MKKQLFISIATALFAATGCDRGESHVALPDNGDRQGGAIIELDITSIESTRFTDTHIYGFDASQKLIYYKYYPTQQHLSSDLLQLKAGVYTFVVALNVGEHFANAINAGAGRAEPLPEITMGTLFSHIKATASDYPDLLSGMTKKKIHANRIARLTIPVKDGILGIGSSQLTLTLTLPGAEHTAYQTARTKATEDYNLRGVVEFYQKGLPERLDRQAAILTPTAIAGQYTLDVQIPGGLYDLFAWVDYTTIGSHDDLYYNTASLQQIKFRSIDQQYAAGGDSREMFCARTVATISAANQSQELALERPAAKYRLMADDVQRYKSLMITNPENYPPLSELSATILYEGYLPDGFNVRENKPNSAQVGYKYKPELLAVGNTDTEIPIGSDYVLVNGTESSVHVTVEIADKTGRKISRVQGVQINYRRGAVTTIKGQFLTSGVVNPGINVSTDWDGIYDVNF